VAGPYLHHHAMGLRHNGRIIVRRIIDTRMIVIQYDSHSKAGHQDRGFEQARRDAACIHLWDWDSSR
jgi:hypothetical protein